MRKLKLKLDKKGLEKSLKSIEGLENFTSIEEIIGEVEKEVENNRFNNDLFANDIIFLKRIDEKLYNGTYKLFTVYVELFNDIEKVYSEKTGKVKNNIVKNYDIRVSIFYNNMNMLTFGHEKNIRSRKIIEKIA